MNFDRETKYTRREVYKIATGKEKMPFDFQQTGYGTVDDNVFAFINIGFKGHANRIFPNKYDKDSKILNWFGKKKTHSQQPLMKKIISGYVDLYCFARWSEDPEFTFLGIGKVLDFKDAAEVYDDKGIKTHCLEFRLSCEDKNVNPSLINNFDESYEEPITDFGSEGAIKYVQHKKRERNTELIASKKKAFLKEKGRLYCEVCDFDFKNTYGKRGEGFIECHHKIPLHEDKKERTTRLSDLALLCSNCHRMIHRKKKWLTIEELRKIYKK